MVSDKFSDKIKTLAAAKAKVTELEQALVHELREEFAALHARFGFSDRQAFLDAVKNASDKPAPRRRRRSARTAKATKTPPARRAKKSAKAKSKR